MGIRFDEDRKLFFLETTRTTYQMKIDEIGILEHLYYGSKIYDADMSYLITECDRGFSGNPFEIKDRRGFSLDTRPQEYAGFGVGDFRINAVGLVGANGSRSVDLRYKGHEIINEKYTLKNLPYVRANGSNVSSVIIRLADEVAKVEVSLLYGVFEDKDVITRSAIIRNCDDYDINLTKAASFCMDFALGQYDLIHFYGRHCMERNMERNSVSNNIQVISSGRGMSSHHHNPFVILCDKDTTENQGESYGFMLMYSGNHKTEIEKDQTGSIRIVSGINNDNFTWQLKAGEEFITPESIISYSANGLNSLSHKFHRIIRENVCNEKYLHMERPILINNWEATYFDFDREKIVNLAKEASSLGIEMLVLDDGWFGKRNDDNRGLGDWFVNEEKISGTLGALVEEVNSLGMKFGLWFEPEMINEDSELYRNHSDWVLRDPDRAPMMSRNQMVLDMTRPDVQDYLFERINAVLDSANIEYVKWDFNRSVSNVFSNISDTKNQGETAHRFILGTYALLERVLEAHPNVMIEGCAGGGGRFDAGILFYSPQIWCSDNTDAIARLQIQKGTSYGYPVSTMGSHVSASPNHQTLRETPLNTRGIVAMSGTFGYELDLSKLSQKEKETIKEQIKYFHKYYWLIQKGDYYRLSDDRTEEYFVAWEFVSENKKEALINIVVTNVQANPTFPFVKLQGLEPQVIYENEETGECFLGEALMKGGYSFGVMQGVYPARQIHLIRKP